MRGDNTGRNPCSNRDTAAKILSARHGERLLHRAISPCVIKNHSWQSCSHLIIWTKFGRRNFAVRVSARCSIPHRFPQSLNTRREFWIDTTAIFFVLPLSLSRNTDFLAKHRTTWCCGRATSIRVFAFPFTVCTPNIASLDTATVYPGMCLLEGTNISEGRGTTRPFEIFGAPFIDAERLCNELNKLRLQGVFFRQNYFQPTFHKFAGELCAGAQLHVTDRNTFEPFRVGVAIIKHIRKTYPDKFQWKQPPYEYEWKRLPIEILIGGPIESVFGD